MDIKSAHKVIDGMGRTVEIESAYRDGIKVSVVTIDAMDLSENELEALLMLLRDKQDA